MIEYDQWLASKHFEHAAESIPERPFTAPLFDYQKKMVSWALEKGRACLFADTGLGKTIMQAEWAHQAHAAGARVLLLAPLAVVPQTVEESAKFGVPIDRYGDIRITNYERLHEVEGERWDAVVLDESSILKAYDGKTRTRLIDFANACKWRLACSATPAPNDHTELGNHSEFVGNKTMAEMLAEYFVHDAANTKDWRLKGHARADFWAWVSTWAAMVKTPADVGCDGSMFALPGLIESWLHIEDGHAADGELFAMEALSLSEQRNARKRTIDERVNAIAEHVNSHKRPAIIWCEYNAESSALTSIIPDAVEVTGSMKPDDKVRAMQGFAHGDIRVLVTKPKIAGFGLNWQHCRDVYFLGPSNSFEQRYQAIRRCWRFGQKHDVTVYTCASIADGGVMRNQKRKQDQAEEQAREISRLVSGLNMESEERWNSYKRSPWKAPGILSKAKDSQLTTGIASRS